MKKIAILHDNKLIIDDFNMIIYWIFRFVYFRIPFGIYFDDKLYDKEMKEIYK